MRLSLRSVLVILVALVAIGSLVSVLPAGKDTKATYHDGACSEENGVTLVIDFATASTDVPIIKCAKDFTGTGWDTFAATESVVEGTAEYETGFVCRLEGVPSKEQQPCTSTPSYDQGSWAYYFATADTGANWMFSGTGSQMRIPTCGSVEGWRFIAAGESGSNTKPAVEPKPYRCD